MDAISRFSGVRALFLVCAVCFASPFGVIDAPTTALVSWGPGIGGAAAPDACICTAYDIDRGCNVTLCYGAQAIGIAGCQNVLPIPGGATASLAAVSGDRLDTPFNDKNLTGTAPISTTVSASTDAAVLFTLNVTTLQALQLNPARAWPPGSMNTPPLAPDASSDGSAGLTGATSMCSVNIPGFGTVVGVAEGATRARATPATGATRVSIFRYSGGNATRKASFSLLQRLTGAPRTAAVFAGCAMFIIPDAGVFIATAAYADVAVGALPPPANYATSNASCVHKWNATSGTFNLLPNQCFDTHAAVAVTYSQVQSGVHALVYVQQAESLFQSQLDARNVRRRLAALEPTLHAVTPSSGRRPSSGGRRLQASTSPTPSESAASSDAPSPSGSPSTRASVTPSSSISRTRTQSASVSKTVTPSSSLTATVSPSESSTASVTVSSTPSPSQTPLTVYETLSTVWTWSAGVAAFQLTQVLPTNGALAATAIPADSSSTGITPFLFVVNSGSGSVRAVPSSLYAWSTARRQFGWLQNVTVPYASSAQVLTGMSSGVSTANDAVYLTLARTGDTAAGDRPALPSMLLRFNATSNDGQYLQTVSSIALAGVVAWQAVQLPVATAPLDYALSVGALTRASSAATDPFTMTRLDDSRVAVINRRAVLGCRAYNTSISGAPTRADVSFIQHGAFALLLGVTQSPPTLVSIVNVGAPCLYDGTQPTAPAVQAAAAGYRFLAAWDGLGQGAASMQLRACVSVQLSAPSRGVCVTSVNVTCRLPSPISHVPGAAFVLQRVDAAGDVVSSISTGASPPVFLDVPLRVDAIYVAASSAVSLQLFFRGDGMGAGLTGMTRYVALNGVLCVRPVDAITERTIMNWDCPIASALSSSALFSVTLRVGHQVMTRTTSIAGAAIPTDTSGAVVVTTSTWIPTISVLLPLWSALAADPTFGWTQTKLLPGVGVPILQPDVSTYDALSAPFPRPALLRSPCTRGNTSNTTGGTLPTVPVRCTLSIVPGAGVNGSGYQEPLSLIVYSSTGAPAVAIAIPDIVSPVPVSLSVSASPQLDGMSDTLLIRMSQPPPSDEAWSSMPPAFRRVAGDNSLRVLVNGAGCTFLSRLEPHLLLCGLPAFDARALVVTVSIGGGKFATSASIDTPFPPPILDTSAPSAVAASPSAVTVGAATVWNITFSGARLGTAFSRLSAIRVGGVGCAASMLMTASTILCLNWNASALSHLAMSQQPLTMTVETLWLDTWLQQSVTLTYLPQPSVSSVAWPTLGTANATLLVSGSFFAAPSRPGTLVSVSDAVCTDVRVVSAGVHDDVLCTAPPVSLTDTTVMPVRVRTLSGGVSSLSTSAYAPYQEPLDVSWLFPDAAPEWIVRPGERLDPVPTIRVTSRRVLTCCALPASIALRVDARCLTSLPLLGGSGAPLQTRNVTVPVVVVAPTGTDSALQIACSDDFGTVATTTALRVRLVPPVQLIVRPPPGRRSTGLPVAMVPLTPYNITLVATGAEPAFAACRCAAFAADAVLLPPPAQLTSAGQPRLLAGPFPAEWNDSSASWVCTSVLLPPQAARNENGSAAAAAVVIAECIWNRTLEVLRSASPLQVHIVQARISWGDVFQSGNDGAVREMPAATSVSPVSVLLNETYNLTLTVDTSTPEGADIPDTTLDALTARRSVIRCAMRNVVPAIPAPAVAQTQLQLLQSEVSCRTSLAGVRCAASIRLTGDIGYTSTLSSACAVWDDVSLLMGPTLVVSAPPFVVTPMPMSPGVDALPTQFVPSDLSPLSDITLRIQDAFQRPVTDAVCTLASLTTIARVQLRREVYVSPQSYIVFPSPSVVTSLSTTRVTLQAACVRPSGDAITPVRWDLSADALQATLCTPGPASMTIANPADPLPRLTPWRMSIYGSRDAPCSGRTLLNPDVLSTCTCRASLTVAVDASGRSAQGSVSLQGMQASANASTGLVEFSQSSIVAAVGTTVSFDVSCQLGLQNVPITGVHTFNVSIAPCLPGFTSQDITCVRCPLGTYSLGGARTQCVSCPSYAVCTNGVLNMRASVFRPLSDALQPLDEAAELHPCFNREACTFKLTSNVSDGSIKPAFGCDPRYTGPLCGVCQAQHALVGGMCQQCLPAPIAQGVVVLLLACFTASVVAAAIALPSMRHENSVAVYRITISYLQGITALKLAGDGASRIPALRSLTGLASAIGALITFGPLECSLSLSDNFLLAVRVLTAMCIPALAAVVVVAALCLIATLPQPRALSQAQQRGNCSSCRLHHGVISTVLYVYYAAYYVILSSCMTALKAYPAPIASVWYVQAALGVKWGSSQHAPAFALGMTGTILHAIIVPLLTFLALRMTLDLSHQGRMNDFGLLCVGYEGATTCHAQHKSGKNALQSDPLQASSMSALLISWRDYARSLLGDARTLCTHVAARRAPLVGSRQRHFAWWEAAIMLRKAGMVALSVFIDDAFAHVVSLSVWLLLFLFAHASLRPFQASWLNHLETMSILLQFVSLLSSLMYLRPDGQVDAGDASMTRVSNTSRASDTVITAVIITTNLCGLLVLLIAFASTLSKRMSCKSLASALGLLKRSDTPHVPTHANRKMSQNYEGWTQRKRHGRAGGLELGPVPVDGGDTLFPSTPVHVADVEVLYTCWKQLQVVYAAAGAAHAQAGHVLPDADVIIKGQVIKHEDGSGRMKLVPLGGDPPCARLSQTYDEVPECLRAATATTLPMATRRDGALARCNGLISPVPVDQIQARRGSESSDDERELSGSFMLRGTIVSTRRGLEFVAYNALPEYQEVFSRRLPLGYARIREGTTLDIRVRARVVSSASRLAVEPMDEVPRICLGRDTNSTPTPQEDADDSDSSVDDTPQVFTVAGELLRTADIVVSYECRRPIHVSFAAPDTAGPKSVGSRLDATIYITGTLTRDASDPRLVFRPSISAEHGARAKLWRSYDDVPRLLQRTDALPVVRNESEWKATMSGRRGGAGRFTLRGVVLNTIAGLEFIYRDATRADLDAAFARRAPLEVRDGVHIRLVMHGRVEYDAASATAAILPDFDPPQVELLPSLEGGLRAHPSGHAPNNSGSARDEQLPAAVQMQHSDAEVEAMHKLGPAASRVTYTRAATSRVMEDEERPSIQPQAAGGAKRAPRSTVGR